MLRQAALAWWQCASRILCHHANAARRSPQLSSTLGPAKSATLLPSIHPGSTQHASNRELPVCFRAKHGNIRPCSLCTSATEPTMTVSKCQCPLCSAEARASDIDFGNRARVYCPTCTTYDLTESAYKNLASSSRARVQTLVQRVKAAPTGKLLVITRDGAAYEHMDSKDDRPAPSWLPNHSA